MLYLLFSPRAFEELCVDFGVEDLRPPLDNGPGIEPVVDKCLYFGQF